MRDLSIVYTRFAAMILVVFYHCFCYYSIWNMSIVEVEFYRVMDKSISYIHIPMFVFASGYLYSMLISKGRYESVSRFFIGKIQRLLIPYVIWGALILVLLPKRYTPEMLFNGISHLWFLLMLFDVFCIVHLTKNIWDKLEQRRLLFVILSLILVYIVVMKVGLVIPFLSLGFAIRFLPVFFIGIFFYRIQHNYNTKLIGRTMKNQLNGGGKIYLLALIVLLVAMQWIELKIGYSGYIHIISYLIGLGIVVWSFYLMGKIVKYIKQPNMLSNTIIRIDKCGMGIYVLHHIVIMWLLQYDDFKLLMESHFIITPIALFVFVLLLSWGMTEFILRIKYLRFILG